MEAGARVSVHETATANEELVDLIQQWQRDNINRAAVVVLAGKSGAGKSTLINHFLTLDKDKAAQTGVQPTSITKKVKRYDGEVNGIPIQAIDMPGLHALDSDSDEDSADDTSAETVVTTLTHITKGKADILIYCVPLNQK